MKIKVSILAMTSLLAFSCSSNKTKSTDHSAHMKKIEHGRSLSSQDKLSRKEVMDLQGKISWNLKDNAKYMAMLRNGGERCIAAEAEIMTAIQSASLMNPYKNNPPSKHITPEIEEALKTNIEFKAFKNGDYYSDYKELRRYLVGAKFYSPALGAYGSNTILEFKGNGVIVKKSLYVLNEEPWSKWEEFEGTWKIHPPKGLSEYPRVSFTLPMSYGENKGKMKTKVFKLKKNDGNSFDRGYYLSPSEKPAYMDTYEDKLFFNTPFGECDA